VAAELNEIQRALGRIEGKQTMMLKHQQDMEGKIDGIDTRLHTVEKRAAWRGGEMGALMGIGVAIIAESAKQLFNNGGGS